MKNLTIQVTFYPFINFVYVDEEIEDYKNILKNPMPHYKKHYHEGVDERPDDREYLD